MFYDTGNKVRKGEGLFQFRISQSANFRRTQKFAVKLVPKDSTQDTIEMAFNSDLGLLINKDLRLDFFNNF